MRDMENVSPVATEYTTPADFCRTFKQDMKSLYLLALLLTAGRQSAEQCFVSSLDDCLDMRSVIKEWSASWTRRIVLQNAIRMLSPAVNSTDEGSPSRLSPLGSDLNPALHAVLRLNTFERFVFVITVLEGYSDRECSQLMGSSKDAVVAAKAKALEHLGRIFGPNDCPVAAPLAQRQFTAMDRWITERVPSK
jgi:hypothetical protein